jgi:hypothetical protein
VRTKAPSTSPAPTATTPIRITVRGPRRSISRPIIGEKNVETKKPMEKAPAVTPRSQPNSWSRGGKSRENEVRALMPMPMVTKATATITQP